MNADNQQERLDLRYERKDLIPFYGMLNYISRTTVSDPEKLRGIRLNRSVRELLLIGYNTSILLAGVQGSLELLLN